MPPPPGGFVPTGPVGTRPKEVDLSFWLWVSSFVLGLVGLLLFVGEFDAIRDTAMQEARRQAQLDGTVLDEAELQRVLSGLYSLTTESGARLGLTAISLLIALGAVVTMFLPAANPWFRSRPAG